MQSQNLNCQICYSSYNQFERVPKICPCGHTLCLHCLDQYFAIQPRCPFCRFNMNNFQENPSCVTTNRALKELVEDKCALHSELRTLICLTCKLEVCSACIFLDKHHTNHKIIHMSQICREKTIVKDQLWAALYNQRRFCRAMPSLLDHSRTIAMKKLMKIEGVVDKKTKEAILQETLLFFSAEEERLIKTLEENQELIHTIQEQIACLDNPRVDEEVLEALGKEPVELKAEKQHKLLVNEVTNFIHFLDQTIESTLLLNSIHPFQRPIGNSGVRSDQTAFFNIRKLLNFDFNCDALAISQKILNTDTVNDDLDTLIPRAKSQRDSHRLFIPFACNQESKNIADITIRILDLLNKHNHALMDFISQQMNKKLPVSLWSLKFWLQGVMVFEINLCGREMNSGEIESLFDRILPQLTMLQEINLDFQETNVEDGTLQKFEDNTLCDLKQLKVLRFNLAGTRATNRGVAWILRKIKEAGENFSVNFGSDRILSKDLEQFIENTHSEGLTTTSFEVYIIKGSPEDKLVEQILRQPEDTSKALHPIDNDEDLNIMIGTEYMTGRQVSEYVQPSEESKYKLIILKLSQQDKNMSNSSGGSTTCSEMQPASTRLGGENP